MKTLSLSPDLARHIFTFYELEFYDFKMGIILYLYLDCYVLPHPPMLKWLNKASVTICLWAVGIKCMKR